MFPARNLHLQGTFHCYVKSADGACAKTAVLYGCATKAKSLPQRCTSTPGPIGPSLTGRHKNVSMDFHQLGHRFPDTSDRIRIVGTVLRGAPKGDIGDWKWCHHRWIRGFVDVYLVGGIATPLKNMQVNWDDNSEMNGKIKNPNHQPLIVIPSSYY